MNNVYKKITLILILVVIVVLAINYSKKEHNVGENQVETEIIDYKQNFVPTESKSGNCWTSSNVASGNMTAYRCMSGNNIYDPCFTTEAKRVVCGVTPFNDTNSFELKLTEPLPVNSESNNQSAFSNWMIELENGVRCSKFSGTAGSIPNENENEPVEMYFYTCDDDGVVVGYPELVNTKWNANVAYIDTKPVVYKVLQIAKMWR